VSAVAVVDKQNKLVGSVSCRDIRTVVGSKPEVEINSPIDEFLEHVRGPNDSADPFSILSCGPLDSVKSVITRMNACKTHRIWILNDEQNPIGVISLGDVCAWILTIQIPVKVKNLKKSQMKDELLQDSD